MPEAKKLVHSCDDSISMVIQTVLNLFAVDGNKDLKSLQKALYDQIEFVKDGIEVIITTNCKLTILLYICYIS